MNRENKIKIFKSAAVFLLFAISISFALIQTSSKENINTHLMDGLGQVYSYVYKNLNPDVKLSSSEEYGELTDEVFGNPKTFTEAFMNNPLEMIKFFFLNGTINILLFFPTVFSHRSYLCITGNAPLVGHIETCILLLTCLAGTILGINRARDRLKGIKEWIYNVRVDVVLKKAAGFILDSDNCRSTILLVMTLPGYISLILLFPQQRYWLPFIPIVILWVAWSLSNVMDVFGKGRKYINVVLLLLIIIVSSPVFIHSSYDNKAVVLKLREHFTAKSEMNMVVAGHSSVGVYIFRCNYKSVQVSSMDYRGLKDGKYKMFIVNDIVFISKFWQENRMFLDSFISDPGKYGYEEICSYNSPGENIYIYMFR